MMSHLSSNKIQQLEVRTKSSGNLSENCGSIWIGTLIWNVICKGNVSCREQVVIIFYFETNGALGLCLTLSP